MPDGQLLKLLESLLLFVLLLPPLLLYYWHILIVQSCTLLLLLPTTTTTTYDICLLSAICRNFHQIILLHLLSIRNDVLNSGYTEYSEPFLKFFYLRSIYKISTSLTVYIFFSLFMMLIASSCLLMLPKEREKQYFLFFFLLLLPKAFLFSPFLFFFLFPYLDQHARIKWSCFFVYLQEWHACRNVYTNTYTHTHTLSYINAYMSM